MRFQASTLALILASGLAGAAEDAEVLAANQAMQRLYASTSQKLAECQDANVLARKTLRNLANVVAQQAVVLHNIRNPEAPQAWTPLQGVLSVAGSLLSLPFAGGEDLPRVLPRWVGIARDADGAPALRFAVDAAASADAKGRNTTVFFLPAEKAAGKLVRCRVQVRGEAIAKGSGTAGGKFVLHYRSQGKAFWPEVAIGSGSFGWTELSFSVQLPSDVRDVFVMLGLSDVTGTIAYRDLEVVGLAESWTVP